jgi:hypothetical protein
MIPIWVDADYGFEEGDSAFLLRIIDNDHGGTTRWYLSSRPGRENRSHAPRLTGWLGVTNNRTIDAFGAVRVTKRNERTDRARVARLEGDELVAFLDEAGYPELAP